MTATPRFLAALIAAAACILPSLASAVTVTLTWDPTPTDDVAGYVVHYGTSPGEYSVSIDVGAQTSWQTSDLPTGQRYYFAVRAYSSNREMGEFSEELSADLQQARRPRTTRFPRFSDFNGDLRDDLLAYNPDTGQYGLGLSKAESFAQLWGSWATGLTISGVNLDNDGNDDLLFYSSDRGTWAGGLSRGDGTFNVVEGEWVPGGSVQAGDLNGDGTDDLFFYDASTGQWSVVVAGPDGTPVRQDGLSEPGRDVTIARLNRAGKAEVVLYDGATGAFSLVSADARGSTTTSGVWPPGMVVRAGRLSAASRGDILLYNPESGEWTVAMRIGDAAFSYRSGSWPAGFELDVQDLDGNGHDEVLAYAPESGRAMICEWSRYGFSCGKGTLAPGVTLMLGDFGGSGHPEVLIYDPVTGRWTRSDPLDPDGRFIGVGQWQPGLTLVGKQ